MNKFGCSLGEAGCVGAHALSLGAVPGEVVRIGVDAGGDWFKKSVMGLDYPYRTNDEGLPNQWLLGSQAGPLCNKWFGFNNKVQFPVSIQIKASISNGKESFGSAVGSVDTGFH